MGIRNYMPFIVFIHLIVYVFFLFYRLRLFNEKNSSSLSLNQFLFHMGGWMRGNLMWAREISDERIKLLLESEKDRIFPVSLCIFLSLIILILISAI